MNTTTEPVSIAKRTEDTYCPGCCHETQHETMTAAHDGAPLNAVSECGSCGYVTEAPAGPLSTLDAAFHGLTLDQTRSLTSFLLGYVGALVPAATWAQGVEAWEAAEREGLDV